MEFGRLDRLFDRVGHFGRYQVFLYFTCAFQNISCGIHYLASVFMTVLPKHTCMPPGKVTRVLFHNASMWRMDDIWNLFTLRHEDHIVVQLEDDEIWELKSCQRFRRDNKSSLNYEYNGHKSSFPCLDGYIYDKSKWDSTVVTQWDLVCNREWFARLIQPTFMFGVLLGALIFGYLSDRVGRRSVLWFTSIGMYLFGIAAAFTLDYYSFMLARFLLAIVSSGYLVVVFVYVTEFIGRKARTWASMHVHSFFAIGTMAVALTAYLVRTWWIYQLILSTVTIPFVVVCWMLPETPFWLLSEGRHEEAQVIVDKMAKWNRTSTCKLSELLSLDIYGPASKQPSKIEVHKFSDLFYDWNIGTRTVIVWLIWFTGCLGFYFFSLNSVNLGGNEYLNLFLMGAVEIPAYVFVCLGMDSMGRRNVLFLFLMSGAVFCGVIMVIPPDYHNWTVVASIAGKFAVGSVFGLIYLYTAELYPTVIRTQALGSGSMVSRAGSIIAPLSLYLSGIWTSTPQVFNWFVELYREQKGRSANCLLYCYLLEVNLSFSDGFVKTLLTAYQTLLVGILAFVSGMLTLKLPETLGKPLPNTWEEAIKLNEERGSS